MKKKLLSRWHECAFFSKRENSNIRNIFLTLLLVCCSVINTHAQGKNLSLSIKSEPLSEVLTTIKNSSGERIIFNENQTASITISNIVIENLPTKQALDKILSGTQFKCEIIDGVYVIKINNSQPVSDKITITGTVVDKLNTPIAGATIRIKDSNIGVSTDLNGSYSITIEQSSKPVILIFSFIGMKTAEVAYQGKKVLNVTLEDDNVNLEDIVVTGIFTRNSESFTGSAKTYKVETLKEISNQNILQSLSALDPSFVIADNNLMGSDPNTPMDITINGTTCITGISDAYSSTANQPLFILDGFESSLQAISDLSMDRVESITILKDAASTAIYGAKAANGVIVVETKRPEAGKFRFRYTGNYQVAWADLTDYNLMNSSEKLEFERLAGHYGSLDENGEILDDAGRALYYKRLARVKAGLNTYWLDEPLRVAPTHEHLLNIEGGDNLFTYGVTFRYKNNEGVMKGSNRENINGTINLLYRNQKFNFSNQTELGYTDINNNTVAFSNFAQMNPYESKYDQNGDIIKVLEENSVYNPLWDMQQKSYDKGDDLNMRNNLILEYRPVTGMRIEGKFGLSTNRSSTEIFKSPYCTEFIGVESTLRGQYDKYQTTSTSYDGSLLVSYGKTSQSHTYNFIAGAQLYENKYKEELYSAAGYTTDQFSNPNFANGYPEGGKPSSSIDKMRSASFYFNGNYAYDMRYLVDFNLRSDGASVFGVNNPFSTTWSFGLGWNIHNENFLKESSIVNYLKLRYSLGNPGNQNIEAKTANSIYTYYTAYQNMFGLAAIVSKWGNKDLEWQRTQINNVGIDIELFNSRLRITADYSHKESDPILLTISQPASTGAASVPMNIGATKNDSYSIMANYQIIKNDNWRWMVNANLLHTKTTYHKIGNMLEKYNEQGKENQTLQRYYDGVSATALWAVKSMGIDPMTGNEIFQRKDGSYTYDLDTDDEIIVGDSNPDIEGNFGTTLRYKDFSFAINFKYRYGGETFLTTLFNKVEGLSDYELRYNQDKRALYNRWQKPGDKTQFRRIDDLTATQMSSRFVAEDNTLECKSISLGYETTTAKWIKSVKLSSFSFRVYMNDIFRVSTVKQERGLNYPFQRAVSASVNLRF